MSWEWYAAALGRPEGSPQLLELTSRWDNAPQVSTDPGDPEGDPLHTTYWEFHSEGVQLAFRGGVLVAVFFYMNNSEEYSPYRGKVAHQITGASTRDDVVSSLGIPSRFGAGGQDPLLGYLRSWISYDYGAYSMRLEFSSEDRVEFAALNLA